MQTIVRFLFLCGVLFAAEATALAIPSIPGDYNFDGVVSHADFTVWGDTIGEVVIPGSGADGNADGIISTPDFNIYREHYGIHHAVLPSILPLSVTSSAIGGNVQWVFTYSHVSGTLGGDLSIDTHGAAVVSEIEGPSFFNVPGRDWLNAIHEGVVIDGTHTFAGLARTGGSHQPDASLVFLTLVTQGLQSTNLSITGEYGYQAQDYIVNQSSTFVPEPGGIVMAAWASAGVGLRLAQLRKRQDRAGRSALR
jgi:hypothetical protein